MSAGASPDVSVIMAAYNAYPHIRRAIDSVLAQTIGLENIEIIVVNDGSTDETGTYLDEVAAQNPCMTVVHQANSGGPAGPRNRALGLSLGRFIFFLDADDELSPDALAAMVNVADENGTDVVVARVKGVGGRNAPKSMFARSVPRTSLLESKVYGTLNPMKMFRAELVQRLGLRFPTDLPWGEDQPFVAAAYLEADGISILADKDYVFWSYLADGSNISTSTVSLADRMPVVDRMFEFVAERLEPGEARDKLMARHFRVELFGSAFVGFGSELDEGRRRAAFSRFRELVDVYYTEGVMQRLSARARVAFHLVAENRYEDFAEYLGLVGDVPAPIVFEGARVFESAPWFRDAERGIPVELYDVTALCWARCEVADAIGTDSGYDMTLKCSVNRLSVPMSSVRVVLLGRSDSPREVELPQSCRMIRQEPSGETIMRIQLTLDPVVLQRLERGTCEAWCVVEIGEFSDRCRLYAGDDPGRLSAVLGPRREGGASGRITDFAPYVTQSGNIAAKAKHEIVGTLAYRREGVGLSVVSVAFRCARGDEFWPETTGVVADEDGSEFPGAVAFGGGTLRLDVRRLPYGAYRVLVMERPDAARAPIDIAEGKRTLVRCADGYAVLAMRGKKLSLVSPHRWVVNAIRNTFTERTTA